MRLGIMQPYFVPYLGYFQLVASVDKFVLLDDVTYIKGGWINRNRVLVDGRAKWITIPLVKASPNRLINEIEIKSDSDWKSRLVRSVQSAYRDAPYGGESLALLNETLDTNEANLSRFLFGCLVYLFDRLGISAEIVPSSVVYPKGELRGAERILDICLREKAAVYVNLPGGRDLYNADDFRNSGISLEFIEPNLPAYSQGSSEFVPGLSIVDALMWSPLNEVASMIQDYRVAP